MIINERTLPAIQADEGVFREFFGEFAIELMATAALFPLLNKQRVIAAHGAWVQDLERINHHEKRLKEGLDHFKRAGHLTYWIRRTSPLIR